MGLISRKNDTLAARPPHSKVSGAGVGKVRGLRKGALEALGAFLQLALEDFDLPGNVDELLFGERAGLGDLMCFAIGAPHGGADFHRDSREPVFPGHGVPPNAAPAIVQRGRGPAKTNAESPFDRATMASY